MSPVVPTGSFRRQIVVLTASVTAVAVVLLVLIVQLVLSQTSSRAVDQVLEDRSDALAGSVRGASGGQALTVPDFELEAGVAVYDNSGRLVAGSAPAALAGQYAALSTTSTPRVVVVAETNRVRAQPFTIGAGPGGVVVLAERLAPYEQAEHYALLVTIVIGLLAVLASAGLAAWVSRRALAPVVVMARTAGEWSEQDLSKRFELGAPTNEITALGRTLDALLDKVSAVIRSEQRLTSELAHELRTPLTAVQGTADLMALRPDLDDDLREDIAEVAAGTRRMAETITGLLELARSSSTMVQASVCNLPAVVAEVVSGLGAVGDRVVVDVPAGLRLAVPHSLAARAIGPLVENAVRLARNVTVSAVGSRPGFLAIRVDDDGPGVDATARDLIFEPGHTSGSHAGAGLGLSLSRRIARSAGGDVRLDTDADGTRFVVEFPSA